jgi:hypothetical protein
MIIKSRILLWHGDNIPHPKKAHQRNIGRFTFLSME